MKGHIHGMMYMRIVITRLLRRKLYARCNEYEKRVNAKVRNYDHRDLDNEMNMVRFYSCNY